MTLRLQWDSPARPSRTGSSHGARRCGSYKRIEGSVDVRAQGATGGRPTGVQVLFPAASVAHIRPLPIPGEAGARHRCSPYPTIATFRLPRLAGTMPTVPPSHGDLTAGDARTDEVEGGLDAGRVGDLDGGTGAAQGSVTGSAMERDGQTGVAVPS